MCAISGHVSLNGLPPKSKIVKKMLAKMKHRGPDGQGFFQNKHIAFGMNRLAIIDIEGGMQPIFSRDKKIVIIGNGEIYNYQKLKKTLSKKYTFSSQSDIEVALHAYEEYGTNFPVKLRGMFALAIYDQTKQQVILCRDRLGEKPLYFAQNSDGIYFGSELKAMISIPKIDLSLDLQQLCNYFYYQYLPECKTPFRCIEKIEPATRVVIDLKTKKVAKDTYWDTKKLKTIKDKNPSMIILKKIEEAVRYSITSDVDVGVALSGGIDSSAILSLYAKQHKDTITAITIGYQEHSKNDESTVARTLTHSKNVKHVIEKMSVRNVVVDFPKVIYYSDELISDVSASALYQVSKTAHAQKLKVLLGGIGGDEIFWGYPWMRSITKDNSKRLNQAFKFFDQTKIFKVANIFFSRIFHPDFKSKINLLAPAQIFSPKKIMKSAQELSRHSLDVIRQNWLIPNCVELSDRLSMANSVESRAPFLDHMLIEIAYQSQKNVLAYNKPHKYWLKNALKDILNKSLINLPKKGFTPPSISWLWHINRSYAHLFSNGFIEKQKIINPIALRLIRLFWVLFPSLWPSVYQLLVLEVWGRLFVEGQGYSSLKPKMV